MLDYLKSLIMSKEDKNRLNEKLNEIKVIKIIIDPDNPIDQLRIPAEQYYDIYNNFEKYIYIIKIVGVENGVKQGFQFIVSSLTYADSDNIHCTPFAIQHGGNDIQYDTLDLTIVNPKGSKYAELSFNVH